MRTKQSGPCIIILSCFPNIYLFIYSKVLLELLRLILSF